MSILVERVRAFEEECRELGDFLVMASAESALARPDAVKAMKEGYVTVKEGVVFVARDENEEIVGSLGFYHADLWYSHSPFLQSRWFFVREDRRARTVGQALLREAKRYAESVGLAAFVSVTTPRKSPGRRASRFAEIVGYTPLGHTLRLH